MSAIEDRRQRAREAFGVSVASSRRLISERLEEAIEAATRVKITDEAVFRAFTEMHRGATARAVVHVALEELGFEVEE